MSERKNNCLIVVQGINENDDYMVKAFEATGLELVDYDIVFVNTEIVFDNWEDRADGFMDKFGDFIKFYLQKDMRIGACRQVRRAYKEAKAKGYQRIDFLAHSLGTIITMTCGSNDKDPDAAMLRGGYVKADNFICMGSPLSFGNFLVGWYVRNHARQFCKNFEADKVFYVYSFNDGICNHFETSVKKVLGKLTIDMTGTRSTSNHSILKYLLDFNRFLKRKAWNITTKAI